MVVTPADLAVVIKTHPRPGPNYLAETLANLKRSLGASVLPADFYISNGQGLTLQQNAAHAIRVGASFGRPWVLVLEDDLDFCDDVLGSIARWLTDHTQEPWPTFPMYVFGANYRQIDQVLAGGGTAWMYPTHAFYGAQALCWRQPDAAELAAWLGDDPYYENADGTEVRDHGHDLLLQRWAKSREESFFLASAPSFVQHIGTSSGIHNQFFDFPSWPGRAWRYTERGGAGR